MVFNLRDLISTIYLQSTLSDRWKPIQVRCVYSIEDELLKEVYSAYQRTLRPRFVPVTNENKIIHFRDKNSLTTQVSPPVESESLETYQPCINLFVILDILHRRETFLILFIACILVLVDGDDGPASRACRDLSW